MRYSGDFKAAMVQKLTRPEGPSATELAGEVGVAQSTLSRWVRQACRSEEESAVSSARPRPVKEGHAGQAPQDWSAEEKLKVVVEAVTCAPAKLGAFLRRWPGCGPDSEDYRRGPHTASTNKFSPQESE